MGAAARQTASGSGTCPTAQPDAPDWLDDLEQPLVYVTLGTVFNRPATFRPLLDGLDGTASALVTIGRNVDPESLGDRPPNVRIERFVPQASGLAPVRRRRLRTAAPAASLGSLAHGLPLVLVPQGADQFDNAARCAAAGAAVVVRPEELTAEAVRLALRRVLDEPSFAEAARARAGRDRRRCRPLDEVVCSRLEEHVAAG